jgi:hypothetical protein
MRRAFAHVAVLTMQPDADVRAPGAAITVALCGQWEHQPPCPLAAHHTSAERFGDQVRLRMLFAAEPTDEVVVRARIDAALAAGELRGPDGVITLWGSKLGKPCVTWTFARGSPGGAWRK